MNEIRVKVEGGTLVATASPDPDYPGIDVEFIPDNDSGFGVSTPRVLFEKPKGEQLRALIWADKDQEDYTNKVEFFYKMVSIKQNIIAEIKDKVKEEYDGFEMKMLRRPPKEIFEDARKIEVCTELKDYIDEQLHKDFTAEELAPIAEINHILDALYRTFLDNLALHVNTYSDVAQIVSALLENLNPEE